MIYKYIYPEITGQIGTVNFFFKFFNLWVAETFLILKNDIIS